MKNTDFAEVFIDGRYYLLFKSGPHHKWPYMIDRETGEIPCGRQRSLLKKYLLKRGVDLDPWERKTTHWCIKEAIKIS